MGSEERGDLGGDLGDLGGDNVQAYVPGDRRRALAAGRELPERVTGAALFVDISGFTALTEALAGELGPQRGAEELTATLETVFGALLAVLDQHGGEAIYFSGDAVTCWLDGDDGVLATACGLAMQAVIATAGERRTPGGREVRLGLKVAVAVGRARRFLVGDPGLQLMDVLAGRVVDALATAETGASPGDVVLSPAAAASVAGRVELDGDLARRVLAPPVLPPPRAAPPALPEDVVRAWLLPAVYDRLVAGHGEFLADLRPAVPLFLRFGGIDFDDDPAAREHLDELVVLAQRAVAAAGGNVLQLTLGDKGAYLYAVFGAPIAHEDDAARACHAALELLALEGRTAATGLTVGIGAGQLRSGTYGSAERRTFCCLGDAVNLAARLMSAAPDGAVWASDQVQRRAGDGFTWAEPTDLRVKGKAEPVRVAALLGRSSFPAARRSAGRDTPLVGREAELALLLGAAAEAAAGRGNVVRLTGDAGLGKSRLLSALGEQLGVPVHAGAAPAFGARGSYGAWQGVVRSLLAVPDSIDPVEVGDHVAGVLAATAPALLPRLPLLGALLGVDLPDNELTSTFSPELRATSLGSLVVSWLAAQPWEGLLVLVVDDAQWLDALSVSLLESVIPAVRQLPVLVVVSGRPETPGLEAVVDLALTELDAPTSRRLLQARDGSLAPDLLDRLVERAQGNPFHLEELLAHVQERGSDLDLPGSLQALVLARIDDLAEGPRRTVKVASVLGRRFEAPTLAGVYPDLGDDDDVRGHLLDLLTGTLVVPEPPAFAFRQAMTEEVAYASIPFALRSTLHDRVGHWLEGTDAPLDLLAHHVARGTDDDRKRHYLVRAGRAAQDRYANQLAVDHYRLAVELLVGPERVDVLQRLGKVLEVQGEWDAAHASYADALELCAQDPLAAARVLADLAEVARKQGRFADAESLLRDARDRGPDQSGLARVLHLEGTLASMQGRYDQARAAYTQSLALREQLADRVSVGALLSNLAVVAEQEGDLTEAFRLGREALAVREQVGDPWAICISQNNLGMVALLQQDFAQAKVHIAESVRLADAVGDPFVVAVGAHNLGNALVGLGELAQAGPQFLLALRMYVEKDDRWTLALLVEDLVPLAVRLGRPTLARRLVGAADGLRAELNAPRGPGPAAALAAALVDIEGPDIEEREEVAAVAALSMAGVAELCTEACEGCNVGLA